MSERMSQTRVVVITGAGGTLGSAPISDGKLRGDEITFKAGNATYTGRVEGNTIRGTVTGGSGGAFTATKK